MKRNAFIPVVARKIVPLILVLALTLGCVAVAYAQTPSDAQYSSPTATKSGNPKASGNTKSATAGGGASKTSSDSNGSSKTSSGGNSAAPGSPDGSGKAAGSGGGTGKAIGLVDGTGKAAESGGDPGKAGGSDKAAGSASGTGKAGGAEKDSSKGGGPNIKVLPSTGGVPLASVALAASALIFSGLLVLWRAGR